MAKRWQGYEVLLLAWAITRPGHKPVGRDAFYLLALDEADALRRAEEIWPGERAATEPWGDRK